MKTSEKAFHEEFNKLVKAFETSSEDITKDEVDAFYKLVKDELVLLDASDLINENAFFTEFEFENLAAANSISKEAFHKFIRFMVKHKLGISKKLKKAIYAAALKVHASSGKTNREIARAILLQLKKELKAL